MQQFSEGYISVSMTNENIIGPTLFPKKRLGLCRYNRSLTCMLKLFSILELLLPAAKCSLANQDHLLIKEYLHLTKSMFHAKHDPYHRNPFGKAG
jgi:hypothetical protein